MKTILEASHREYRTFIAGTPGLQPVLPIILTEHGVLDQFARYIHLNRRKSRSWQDSATFAVQLLLEYMEANQSTSRTPQALFSEFSTALFTGTIERFNDPSGLWWQPRQPEDANKLIGHLTHFSDWLSSFNEKSNLQLNPWKEATRHEQRLNWAAYSHSRDNSFLSHLWQGDPTGYSRSDRTSTPPINRQSPTKAFPEEKFGLLIEEGFRRYTRDTLRSTDLRNSLISYLMHFGGLRLSEALSLWSDDVSIEDGEVIVRVFHPQYGRGNNGKKRSDILQQRYGLQPRNTLVKATDPLFLGWKNCLLTDPHRRCFEVYFHPHNTGLVFAALWRDYHLKQRVKPTAGENHPYAFTNKNGQPYSHRMFRKAHKLAIERIGLEYAKLHGTTPHGHRHAYGQRLAENGADPLLIKNAMHHASITSSQIYTEPTAMQIRRGLCDVELRLRGQDIDDTTLDASKRG
ncbi:gamma-mobile-trio recombinase GmtY [Pseudomonas serbica]